ncbi:ABC transporter permease [Actinomadura sp. 3N407]|uniref:ABC transporter permease n=1 Tax=Actinomadura sp. 3N407 TaxID=3457423 RepID=UPI003FCC82A9
MPRRDGGGGEARGPGLWFRVSAAWLVVLVLAAALADLLPLKDPAATFRGVSRDGPSAEHWFGADGIGHDVFSQTIHGARRSLAVATVATIAGLVVGGALGMVAGYYRRALDTAIVALLNVMLSIPGLVMALALVAFFAPPGTASPQRQTVWVAIALAILAVPAIARVARAQTMIWAEREFVLVSRTMGARDLRIMLREVLPNVLPAMVSFAFVGLAVLIVVEAALAFFGIGDVTGVSWGLMIHNGRAQLDEAPHTVLFPSLFMFLTVLALNVLGDRLRDKSDTRERGI